MGITSWKSERSRLAGRGSTSPSYKRLKKALASAFVGQGERVRADPHAPFACTHACEQRAVRCCTRTLWKRLSASRIAHKTNKKQPPIWLFLQNGGTRFTIADEMRTFAGNSRKYDMGDISWGQSITYPGICVGICAQLRTDVYSSRC